MNKSTLLAALAFASMMLAWLSPPARASEDKSCKDVKCAELRPTCFNLYCSYWKDPDRKEGRCDAAARFDHVVTASGGEVWNNSNRRNNPSFEVSCEDERIYSGTSHRYTDRLGTRIQGVPGPYPAIILPPGSLKELRHYSESALETPHGILRGYCYIYTGPQLQ